MSDTTTNFNEKNNLKKLQNLLFLFQQDVLFDNRPSYMKEALMIVDRIPLSNIEREEINYEFIKLQKDNNILAFRNIIDLIKLSS